jgi:tetratricopeptide (TPR) repeat protein/tRNA A-37 threonylcarbamoyl transferase component Bud32
VATQTIKAPEDLLFGTIAVREGYVSPAQIEECVKIQHERGGSKNPAAKLGLLLVERGYMSNEQVASILDIQKRQVKAIDADPHRGGLFGQLCLDLGFIVPDRLDECLKEQEALAKKGQPAMLGQIMLRKGYIHTDQFLRVLKIQRRRVMRCPGCDTFYNIEDQEEGAKFICRRCGTIVTVQSPEQRPAGTPDTAVKLMMQGKHDIGSQFGRYLILEELGRGGMGIVYKALHRDLNAVFALKLLKESDLATTETIDRFRREAQAAARLKHPNIVGIHDAGVEDGIHYIAMDFIDGQSFAYRMAQRPKIREMVQFLEKVARAVQHAHEHNVIHRDLKPGNVMIDKSGEPHVMDFGLAKIMDTRGLTRTGSFLGTPFYMSPEQIRGGPDPVDHQSDVYSMGVILYEVLTGRPPHTGQNSVEIFNRILNEEPPDPGTLNPRVHPDLVTICVKAIEKDRKLRYQTSAEFADDLKRYLDGEPIRARPLNLVGRAVKRARKNPAATLATVAFTLLLASGIILAVIFYRSNAEFERSWLAGRDAFAQQRYEDARMHLEAARSRRPGHGDVVELLRQVDVKLTEIADRRAEAAERARQLQEATPTLLEARALLDDLEKSIPSDGLGADAILGACSKIEAALQQALATAPHAAEVYTLTARSLALRGAAEDAIERLTLALGKEPAHHESLALRARLRLRRWLTAAAADARPAPFPEAPSTAEARRQAIADLQALARVPASRVYRDFAEAALAAAEARMEEARRLLDAYVTQHTTDPDALRLRGTPADLRRAIRYRPTDVGLWLQLATALEAAGDVPGAEQALKSAAAQPMAEPPAGAARAAFLLRRRAPEAEAAFAAVARDFPTHAPAFLGLGRARLAADPAGALAPLERATELAPDDPLVYHARAEAFLALRRLDQALRDAEAVVRLLPERAAGFEIRGRVAFADERWADALTDFDGAIARDASARDRIGAQREEARRRSRPN